MCAIFGMIGKTDHDLLKKVSKIQIYRGPDNQGFFESDDKRVLLGNNRLAVIDKKNGNQPIMSANGRYVVVFNGCIYNFLEIKGYLLKKNIKFNTNSDTEVIANAFMHFKEKSFNYFDGMWSVAIYDKKEKNCFLSRDYVGQKPLYYKLVNNYFLFSSQLKGLFQDKNVNNNISLENLKKYYAFSFVPAPNTVFENIYQVCPGETIKIPANKLELIKNKYWSLENGPDYNNFFKKEKKEEFVDNFNKLIKQHYIADKNPVVALSSGIDSNIILNSILNDQKNPNCVTIGFDDKSYDESILIKNIDGRFNRNIYKISEKDLIEKFSYISKLISEPNGDSSFLPTYILYEKIKKYSNVSLGGDGGDESFFGYITFDAFILGKMIKNILPNFIFSIINKFFLSRNYTKKYMSKKKKLSKFFSSLHLEKKYLLPAWLSCLNLEEHSENLKKELNIEDLFSTENIFTSNNDYLRAAQLYHFKYYLPMVLSKVDQASMLNSVESRSPFISKKIINFTLDQNTKNLYSLFNKKKFLKKVYKSIISKKILNTPKHGFAFPTHIILKNEKLVNKLIKPEFVNNYSFFQKKYKSFLNDNIDNTQYLWNELILNLSIQNLNSN